MRIIERATCEVFGMANHDDDDEPSGSYRFPAPDDSVDESETPADDRDTIRCPRCRKFIFDDAEQCPYCKTWLTGGQRAGQRPTWFIITAIICLIIAILWVVGGYAGWRW